MAIKENLQHFFACDCLIDFLVKWVGNLHLPEILKDCFGQLERYQKRSTFITWRGWPLEKAFLSTASNLIFVTGTTGGACGEKICHVEKFPHMTDCHWRISQHNNLSRGKTFQEMLRKSAMWRNNVYNL